MDANINAIGLLLVIGVTAVLLWKFGSKPKTPYSVPLAILIFFIFAFYLGPKVSYGVHDGTPIFQMLIPGLCLFLLLIFIDKAILKLLMLILLFSATLSLAKNYKELRDTGKYTGASDLSEYELKKLKISTVEILLEEAKNNTLMYPQGWLRASLSEIDNDQVKNILKETPMHKIKVIHFWHSWFTGLYGKTEGELIDIWYPGGTLKDAAERIEFRRI